MTAGIIRVGVSGWTYGPWRGVFYPDDVKREQELAYAASHLRTIEINSTFFGTQRSDSFANWAEQVPADFAFAVRAPRAITHILRLRDARTPLANFLASGLLRLGVHLGPTLWQLPANLRFDPQQIDAFLRLLPHDTGHAAILGQQHDKNLRTSAWLNIEMRRPMRHAIEAHHDSFQCQEFIDMLRAYDVALVCSDAVQWPQLMDVTSDFVYCRLHASRELHPNGYSHAALDEWSRRCKAWAQGEEPRDGNRIGGKARVRKRDVFVFFDNDKKVHAPGNAMELIRRLRA